MGNHDFTIATWLKLESSPSNDMHIISKWSSHGQLRKYNMSHNGGTELFQFSVSNNGTTIVAVTPVILAQ